jgi:hypothetical protein
MFGGEDECIGMAFGIRSMEWKSRPAVSMNGGHQVCENHGYNGTSMVECACIDGLISCSASQSFPLQSKRDLMNSPGSKLSIPNAFNVVFKIFHYFPNFSHNLD